MPLTFWTRGDSPNANNNSLNVQGTNQYPTTQVTFQSTTGGDEKLEFNNGNPDPDTEVVVNGVTYQFVVEFVGTFDADNKLNPVGGEDLRGEELMVVTLVAPGESLDGQRIFFLTDPDVPITESVMDDFPNGAIPISNLVEDCFVAGTLIATPDGPRQVETLASGDLVCVEDGRFVPLLWVGHRRVESRRLAPHQRPVGLPLGMDGVLWLSPLHRVKVTDGQLDRLFAEPSALIAARDMPNLDIWKGDQVHYVHLLCAEHEIVRANGVPVETLYPPRITKTRLQGADPLGLEERVEHHRLAAPSLTRKEAALWRQSLREAAKLPA